MEQFDAIVVGAGSAGSLIANQLQSKGTNVLILDKSRGSGGRCARRQIEPSHSVDIGCIGISETQYKDIQQHTRLAQLIDAMMRDEILKNWHIDYGDGNLEQQLVGCPNMNSIHKYLLDNLTLKTQHRVSHFSRGEHDNWIVECDNGAIFSCTRLIITSPPAQTHNMSPDWPQTWLQIFDEADKSIKPQWCCVIEVSKNVDLSQTGLKNHPIIDHAVLDSSKPNRDHSKSLWVVHATPEWTEKHLQLDAPHAGDLLCDAFCSALNIKETEAIMHTSHRWLFGRSVGFKLVESCLWDRERQLGVCADWLNGGGIAAAFMSADTLLQRMK